MTEPLVIRAAAIDAAVMATKGMVGIDHDEVVIQAIKDELQRFHRAPNLTGISIINDPDLLQKESAS